MPAKPDAWREVVLSVSKSLAVITQSDVEREIAMQVNVVLNEKCVEPLWQLVAADPEVDRLRVVLHVGKCELTKRSRRCVAERERAEDRSAGFTAGAAGGVVDHATAETQVVFACRPRQRVGKLHLVSPKI